ncbi:universal stress protein [Algibacter sp.]|nr:universal stress protein [Algibacter sp.]
MKSILVAVDFNKNEQLLIDKSFQMANAFDSKLWFIHAAAPKPDFAGYSGPQSIRDSRAQELRKEHKLLEKHSSDIKKKGVDATALLIQGATVETIIKESKKLNVDLIITGHHDHSFFYNMLNESVSAKIIKNSKIPVLYFPLG